MQKARIYRPAKTAMQSGRFGTKRWALEFEPAEAKRHDPLMGWIGSGDTRQQFRLRFDTKEEAVAYAEEHGIAWWSVEPRERRITPKSYAENFRWQKTV